MGKNLHFVNSSTSSSKTELTVTLSNKLLTPKNSQNPKNCILSTSIVDKLSADDLSKLDLDSDFSFFFLNLGIVMPPVIKFDVDLDSSFNMAILAVEFQARRHKFR